MKSRVQLTTIGRNLPTAPGQSRVFTVGLVQTGEPQADELLPQGGHASLTVVSSKEFDLEDDSAEYELVLQRVKK